jgi:hypothetical protein
LKAAKAVRVAWLDEGWREPVFVAFPDPPTPAWVAFMESEAERWVAAGELVAAVRRDDVGFSYSHGGARIDPCRAEVDFNPSIERSVPYVAGRISVSPSLAVLPDTLLRAFRRALAPFLAEGSDPILSELRRAAETDGKSPAFSIAHRIDSILTEREQLRAAAKEILEGGVGRVSSHQALNALAQQLSPTP